VSCSRTTHVQNWYGKKNLRNLVPTGDGGNEEETRKKNFNRKKKEMKKAFFLSLLLALIAVGCIPGEGVTFSPEQAGIRAATGQFGDHGVVNPDSVVLRQMQKFDNKTFVMVSYERAIDGRIEKCTMMHEVRQTPIGTWTSGSGGGGCSGRVFGDDEPMPEAGLEIGGGSSSGGGPLDSGYSHVNGLVNQSDIATVRAIWEDGTTSEAPVVNNSYLIFRPGTVGFTTVQGLNENGDVVFGFEPEIAPGKEP
jgi:hypothetical protein